VPHNHANFGIGTLARQLRISRVPAFAGRLGQRRMLESDR